MSGVEVSVPEKIPDIPPPDEPLAALGESPPAPPPPYWGVKSNASPLCPTTTVNVSGLPVVVIVDLAYPPAPPAPLAVQLAFQTPPPPAPHASTRIFSPAGVLLGRTKV